MIAISEHRVHEAKADKIIKKILSGWKWCHNVSTSCKGIIWVIWNPNVLSYTVIERSAQIIHGTVKLLHSNKEFQFSAVYGLHNVQDRKSLWDMLRDMEGQIMGPWLIMGDFNTILGAEDRVHGREVQDHETKDFRALMEDCSLTELPTVGKSYTWTNSHVYSRIDRAIVNDNWKINMPPLQVHIMNSLFSDHSPLGIEVEGSCDKKKRHFKFYNCMEDHPDFGKIVEDNWGLHEGSMAAIWQNLKNVRSALKQLNTKEFMNIAEKIRTIREKMKDIQGRMRTSNAPNSLFEEEKDLLLQLEKWDKIKESIYKQKSRVQWLQLRDTNSAYFFASMKGRKVQNQITKLIDSNGDVMTNPKKIEDNIQSSIRGAGPLP
nr:uncharacterized protein LOC104093526 [Nicotiana tomentosiformis]